MPSPHTWSVVRQHRVTSAQCRLVSRLTQCRDWLERGSQCATCTTHSKLDLICRLSTPQQLPNLAASLTSASTEARRGSAALTLSRVFTPPFTSVLMVDSNQASVPANASARQMCATWSTCDSPADSCRKLWPAAARPTAQCECMCAKSQV